MAKKDTNCSFCGSHRSEVNMLIAGVSGHICDSCAVQAEKIVSDEMKFKSGGSAKTESVKSSETFTNKTLTSPLISGLSITDSSIVFEGSVADEFETTITVTNPTADRTITLPDATGTVALQGFIPASLTWGDLKNGKSA